MNSAVLKIGDHVRIISAEEYRSRFPEHSAETLKYNSKLLERYGNQIYEIEGFRDDGKFWLKDNGCGWPAIFLDDPITDWINDADIQESDFMKMIGEN